MDRRRWPGHWRDRSDRPLPTCGKQAETRVPSPGPAAPIVGRDRELETLRNVVFDLASGRGRSVWIVGENGIGKSTVVRQMAATARECGCRVVHATWAGFRHPMLLNGIGADPLVTQRATDEIADASLPGAPTSDGAGDPVLAAADRLLALIDQMCDVQPVMLVLEDMHWADSDRVVAWHRLSRLIDQRPLVLVASRQLMPPRPDIEQVRQALPERHTVDIRLGPLTDDDAATLAGRLLGARLGCGLREEIQRTGGNPRFVRELVDVLRRDRLIRTCAGVAELAREPRSVPGAMGAAIAGRLAAVSGKTRMVLCAAALLGTEFDVTDLSIVMGRAVSTLVAPLEEALATGILDDGGERMVFRHTLIRQALHDHIPEQARARRHRAMARLLADAQRPVEQVATLLLAAPGLADDWMIDWLLAMPTMAGHAAPRCATDLLRRAMAHTPAPDPRWEALAVKLATILMRLHEREEAALVVGEVLRCTTDPEVAGRMAWSLAHISTTQGEWDEAAAVARRALTRPDVPARWRSLLRSRLALSMLYHSGPRALAYAEAGRALEEAERAGDPLSVGYARHTCYLMSDHESGLEHLDRALAVLGDDPDSVELRLKLLAIRMISLSELGRDEQVEQTLHEALVLGETARSPRGNIHVAMAVHLYTRGLWDHALVEIEAGGTVMDPQCRLLRHGLAAVIAGRRNDRATLEAQLEAVAYLPIDGCLEAGAEYVMEAQALALEADRDLRAATTLLAQWLDPRLSPSAQLRRHVWLPNVVRLALAVGNLPTARHAAKACAADADTQPLPARRAAAYRCRAMLDDDPQALVAAAELYRETQRPLDVAATLEEASVAFARAGDINRARLLFAEVHRTYVGLGAEFDLRRAERRLREFGIRRTSRTVRRQATAGWAALTAAELRIAELVAGGMSNAEIGALLSISRRTVTTHVSHILTKLDARSRVAIVQEVWANPSATTIGSSVADRNGSGRRASIRPTSVPRGPGVSW